jgi:hypothetical protein
MRGCGCSLPEDWKRDVALWSSLTFPEQTSLLEKAFSRHMYGEVGAEAASDVEVVARHVEEDLHMLRSS